MCNNNAQTFSITFTQYQIKNITNIRYQKSKLVSCQSKSENAVSFSNNNNLH